MNIFLAQSQKMFSKTDKNTYSNVKVYHFFQLHVREKKIRTHARQPATIYQTRVFM